MYELAENEKWVTGYDGMYSVDTTGEVYSYRRGKKHKMVGGVIYDNSRGFHTYRVITLSNNSVQRNFYYHRLVAQAFIPNPENKKEVNHINGVKQDNWVENLEWATRSENTQHAYDTGLIVNNIFTEEQRVERAMQLLINNEHSGVRPKHARNSVTKDELISAHVPPEFISVSKPHNKAYSHLDNWNHYIDLFRLCDDSNLSLTDVTKIVDMDQSMISLIRNGKRAKTARKIYDKYKNDPYYFVNYKPVY
jgi:hypothetical protein